MKQLLLLRHGHAVEARDGLEDIDRPLTRRGRAEALDAAQCIAVAQIQCDYLLVSPAARARETATIVAAELDLADGIHFDPALYPGEPDALLAALRRCPAAAGTLMIVGHNPGLSALAQRFQGKAPPIELHTAGLCAVTFAARTLWSDLRPALARRVRQLR